MFRVTIPLPSDHVVIQKIKGTIKYLIGPDIEIDLYMVQKKAGIVVYRSIVDADDSECDPIREVYIDDYSDRDIRYYPKDKRTLIMQP